MSEAERGRAAEPDGGAGRSTICSVSFCPICAAVAAVGEARPELTEHLLAASREMLLALRDLIDARLEGVEERPSGPQRVQKINVR